MIPHRNEEKKKKQERVQELAMLSRGRRIARAEDEDRRARVAMMQYQHQVFGLGGVTAAASNMYAAGAGFGGAMGNVLAGEARSELVQNFRDKGNMFAWNRKGSSNIDVSVEDPIEDEIGPPAFARRTEAANKKKKAAKGKFVQIDDDEE